MHISQIVNSVFSSNTYILSYKNSKQIWLIDIGDIEPILSYISNEHVIDGVFITHTHYDHIFGIKALVERFPDCTIYTSANGRLGFKSDKYNFSKYHNDSILFDSPNMKIVSEGDYVNLFDNYQLEIFETPGHDWSSLVYRIGKRALFTGDSYIPGINVVTTFPKSNKEDAIKSTEKILSLCSNETIIYPGHGDIYKYR
jgi:glyoxylase-like metal-dependent hydrolase (beta-lactamase superfamily II)